MIFFSLSDRDAERLAERSTLAMVLETESRRLLFAAINSLPSQEKQAVLSKYGFPEAPTIRELAAKWGCERQRVYQIAEQAIRRLCVRLKLRGLTNAST